MRLLPTVALLTLALCLPRTAHAAADLLPLEGGAKASPASMPLQKLPALDFERIATEDALGDAKGLGGGFRYAVPETVSIDAAKSGSWRKAADGRRLWYWRVNSPDALHLNFGFTDVFLPEGASLRILAADGSSQLGPYTSADNERHRELWTAPLFANEAIIELAVPEALQAATTLRLVQVGRGYRGFGLKSAHCKSGACNTDVACLGADDPWNLPRRAVASYSLGGGRLCTGSLLNNTRGDRRMLFVTATHCEITASNAASLVVFWNFEAPTCRTPGSAASGSGTVIGSTTQNQTGAIFLAATNNPFGGPGSAESRSDFTLLELDDPPNPAFNLFWAGWDRRASAPFCGPGALCASIHHPDGDEKRITFSEDPLATGDIANATGVHWTVRWDPTPPILPNLPAPLPTSLPPSVTEPGSSGSPLYDASQRLVGVLSGGASFCGAGPADLNDEYGQLAKAWDGLGTPATRVRDALDPNGGTAQAIDGLGGCTAPTINFSAPASVAAGARATFDVTVSGQPPFQVQFDYDEDGVFDASVGGVQTGVQRSATFPTRGGRNVQVRVTDRNNCAAFAQRAVVVQAPDITLTAQAPTQVCGNGNAEIDPGELWRIPVSFSNGGELATDEGVAIFARGTQPLGSRQDSFGYRMVDETSGVCPYNFVDLAAEPTLSLVGNPNAADDGRAANPLALGPGGAGVPFYGTTVTSVVMSTNGYLATSTSDDGRSLTNTCGVSAADGGRINVLYDDHVVNSGGGLRYRYFASCPRPGDAGAGLGCAVFQWTNLRLFEGGSSSTASAEFQTLVYDNGQIVNQYRQPDARSGGQATVSIQNAAGTVGLQYACNTPGSVPAGRAVCAFPPGALPRGLQTPAKATLDHARTLGSLAAGQTLSANVDVAFDPAAACGTPAVVRYVGAVDRASSSMRPATILNRTLGGGPACTPQPQCYPDASTRPLPARRDGAFTNFSRLGNGLMSLTIPSGNQWTYAGAWFTANRDHTPTWYLLQGEFGDRRLNAQAENQLYRFRQTSVTPFRSEGTIVGEAQVTFITPSDLVFTWTLDGVPGGERMVIGNGTVRPPNERTGAWFSSAESGWGIVIDDHFLPDNSTEQVVVNYLYDAAGRPTWTLGGGSNLQGGTVQHRSFAVHCPGCPAPVEFTTAPAGTTTISYSGLTTGTYSSSINLPAPQSGTWPRSNLPIQLLSTPQPAANLAPEEP
jgi:lysyl endopeptidase